MKMRLPKKEVPTLKVSVEGKSYDVSREGNTVDLPNDTPASILKHLLGMGWLLADEAAAKKAVEAGIELDSKGQAKA